MGERITLYGAQDCDDTERTRARLVALNIPFEEVDIDQVEDAAAFVRIVNHGYRSTPTLLFGAGKQKTVLTEPTDEELDTILVQFGYPAAI